MPDYGEKLFDIDDIKITDLAGAAQVDLPVSRVMQIKERLRTGELSGDGTLQAVASHSEAVEWSLEAGGISLLAYAKLSGRTAVVSGTTPNEVTTLTFSGAERFPYMKIYGRSLDDDTGDTHVLLYKAKVIGGIEGSLQDGQFMVTKCNGIAVDDGSNGIMDVVQHETAEALPAT
jgi:hypothetical protein